MADMTHDQTRDLLNAAIDGELDAESKARLNAALAANPALGDELVELRATRSLLASLPEYTPRRSFTLGAEFARETRPSAAPQVGTIVRLLPVVRALSVAAVLVFMVVGGALFFDLNGNTTNTSNLTFEEQNAIMAESGGTDEAAEASEHAEDAPGSAHAGDDEPDGSSMTERGDAASAGDEPMDDLTEQEAPAPSESMSVSQVTDDSGHTEWKWMTAGIGGLAIALTLVWMVLARTGKSGSISG